ncbi:MAG: SDR family NAD(P)-dependent oxidoreductase [Acidobacteriota bacterium]|nr:SDR family oxidoreductase [Blastocatellia bacterium]MDW8238707.1 SDR family NAD(P)-dependent oxidoreductase [Acidobacteriota bacterium]
MDRPVTIITGATGSLGRVVTRAFLQTDATVIAIYRTPEHWAELIDFLGGEHERLRGYAVDVTREEPFRDAVYQVFDTFGRIDVLVHLVGGYIGDVRVVQMEETTWDYMMTLNLKSAFFCSKTVLNHMLDQGGGKIIFVGARAAVAPFPGAAAYAVSKAGVHALTQAIASEVAGHNINVNAVLPATLDTPLNRQAMPDADFSTWVQPEALAQVILFLASDAAKHIHGALIPVYGTGA